MVMWLNCGGLNDWEGGDWSPHGAEAKKQNDDQDMSEILLNLACYSFAYV